MGRERTFVTGEPEATLALAQALARGLPRGAVVALEGELGAGKTTFVRGLARGLGLADPVTSPTFTLMHRYGGGQGERLLDHFDAWMEGRERAFLADGGAEVLGEADVAAIEWSERVGEALPPERVAVRLVHLGPGERGVTLEVLGEGPLAEALERALGALEAPPGAREVDRGPASRPPSPGEDRD